MKSGCLWLLLYTVAVVPLALFGASMAGEYVYGYDHRHRPRLSQQAYRSLLDRSEAVSAIVCGVPGLLLVGGSHLRGRRAGQQERAETPQQ